MSKSTPSKHAEHSHDHGSPSDDHVNCHGHGRPGASGRVLGFAFILIVVFAAVEAVGGWLFNSVALMSDAGHMVTDAASLLIGWIAASLATRPPSDRHSYGWQRAEVLGALLNLLFMWAVIVAITIGAIARFREPAAVNASGVMIIAFIGLLVNIGAAKILHSGDQNLNVRGAMLHVMGDLLGSVAALVSGIVIWQTGWVMVDPLLSMLIAGLILASSVRLAREVLAILMEAVPRAHDLAAIGDDLTNLNGVTGVHDLHVWAVGSDQVSLSAHLVIDNIGQWSSVLDSGQEMLRARHGLDHVTLQPEVADEVRDHPVCDSGFSR